MSRKVVRLLPWAAGLVLVAGIVAVLVAYLGNTGKSLDLPRSNRPAQIVKKEKTVPFEQAARRVAERFILTAVARRHLAESWTLVAPSMKRGFTLAQWKTGAIPVVPYPADPANAAPVKIDYSYKDRALLEIALFPRKGVKVKPQLFFLGLHAYGKGKQRRWLVDYWAPRSAPSIPQG